MQEEPTYKVYFNGEVYPGAEVESVKKKIASMFGVHDFEVSPMFVGETAFQRSGLNKFTAEQYVTRFQEVGALCHITQEPNIQITRNASEKTQTVKVASIADQGQCPKCHSSNIDSQQCLSCGIYIEKYRRRIAKQLSEKSDADKDALDIEEQEYLSKAKRIIRYTMFYLVAIFTVDHFIFLNRNNDAFMLILGVDFEVGILLYALGHIGLAFGCYYLALAKGWKGTWGALGLAGLPGLAVLLLLPNKRLEARSFDIKTKAFAVAMLLLSAYWLMDTGERSKEVTSFMEISANLREQRHEYPSDTFDSDPQLFAAEIAELKSYLEQGFRLINDNDFSSKDIQDLAETMFSEATRLLIWLNYQTYLQFRNGAQGPDSLNKNRVEKLQVEIFKIINDGVKDSNLSILRTEFRNWFLAYNPTREGYFFLSRFIPDLFEIRMFLVRLPNSESGALSPPNFSFNNLTLPKIRHAKVSTEDDLLLLDLTENNIEGASKKVVIAYYYSASNRFEIKNGKKVRGYYLEQLQISPDFPNKYLGQNFHVIHLTKVMHLRQNWWR